MSKRLKFLIWILIQIQFVAICALLYFNYELHQTINELVEENSALQSAFEMLKYYLEIEKGNNI